MKERNQTINLHILNRREFNLTPDFVQMRSKVKAMEMERTQLRQAEISLQQTQEVQNKLRQLKSMLCDSA